MTLWAKYGPLHLDSSLIGSLTLSPQCKARPAGPRGRDVAERSSQGKRQYWFGAKGQRSPASRGSSWFSHGGKRSRQTPEHSIINRMMIWVWTLCSISLSQLEFSTSTKPGFIWENNVTVFSDEQISSKLAYGFYLYRRQVSMCLLLSAPDCPVQGWNHPLSPLSPLSSTPKRPPIPPSLPSNS